MEGPQHVINGLTGLGARLVHARRRTISLAAYAVVTALSLQIAYLLRFEFAVPPEHVDAMLLALLLLVPTRLLASHLFRLTSGRWRFTGTGDVLRLAGALASGSAVFIIAGALLGIPPVPRSVLVLEPALTMLFTAGLWLSYRTAFELTRHHQQGGDLPRRVLIIGAGEAGEMLTRQMLRFPTGLRPIGFIDDASHRRGTRVHDIEVLGTTAELPRLARQLGADEIAIAVPSAEPADLRRIVEICEATRLPFKVLPGIAEVLAGNVHAGQLREVRIEDLLGRDPIELEMPELAQDLDGECVLITGAAGSIGSELSRQIALHRPSRLVLLDQAETDLYYLELELRDSQPDLDIVAVIADIVDASSVERVFRAHRPSRVYHAAAYKHVPLMESNVREAVHNNVIGTWRVAENAGRFGAAQFVLVSTDKAVRPTSVMGATKRVAELVTLCLQGTYPETAFCAVRFGNVLGSNGSVIPLFRRQLAAGQPLTITHPEVTRYFMTIPEAVQLILKASLLPAVRGHIAMLDMGEAIRIADLARNLIRLSGALDTPDRLRYTGMRRGEKLHEELIAPDEQTMPTAVEKISIVMTPASRFPNLPALLQEWEDALRTDRVGEVSAALASLFPALRIGEQAAEVSAEPAAVVVELPQAKPRSRAIPISG